MKMQIMRLKRQRGFTLVECIIAIAVFGVLCLAVMMILTNAQTLAHNATDSEESLTALIDNVVGDNTHRKYSPTDSKVLELKLSNGTDFKISYDTISGYKDFVQCPNPNNENGDPVPCGYMATNTEFMLNADGSRMEPKDFNPTSMQYTCPKCDHSFKPDLICEECKSEGQMGTAAFTYISNNDGENILAEIGSFRCKACKGTTVKVKGIDAAITSNSNFSLGGMIPNGIRYGEVKFREDDEKESLISITDASGNPVTGASLQVILEYEAKESHAVSGNFKLTLNSYGSLPSGYKINIKTPQYYNISEPESPSSYTVTVDNKESDPEEERLIVVSGSGTAINATIKFKCLNYRSGYSIQYDYNRKDDDDAQGLFQWFFDENANLQNVTRDKNGLYLTYAKRDRYISF